MKNADRSITLYNYRLDPKMGYDTCTRHIIEGVSIFGSLAVDVSKEGFAAADIYTLRVPEECGSFEFREGDVILTGVAAAENPRKEKTPDQMTVVSCTDNRSKRAPHWKVVCR